MFAQVAHPHLSRLCFSFRLGATGSALRDKAARTTPNRKQTTHVCGAVCVAGSRASARIFVVFRASSLKIEQEFSPQDSRSCRLGATRPSPGKAMTVMKNKSSIVREKAARVDPPGSRSLVLRPCDRAQPMACCGISAHPLVVSPACPFPGPLFWTCDWVQPVAQKHRPVKLSSCRRLPWWQEGRMDKASEESHEEAEHHR